MRPPGSHLLQAILLFSGITIALRVVTRFPSGFPLLTPDLLGAALFLYAPFLYYRKGRVPAWIRLTNPKRSAALFLALGAGGGIAYFLASSLPLFPSPSVQGAQGTPFGAFVLHQAIFVALPEEVFFRGYLYDVFEEQGWEPVAASSFLFAVGHLAVYASAYRALTFFPALLFGWGRKKSGNLYVPVILHLLFNLFPHLSGAQG